MCLSTFLLISSSVNIDKNWWQMCRFWYTIYYAILLSFFFLMLDIDLFLFLFELFYHVCYLSFFSSLSVVSCMTGAYKSVIVAIRRM
jgi:hypothetical protein